MRNMNFIESGRLLKGLLCQNKQLKIEPTLTLTQQREKQFIKLQNLVRYAFENIPFYNDKYSTASFHPNDLRSWNDFHSLPTVSKEEVIAHYPNNILCPNYSTDELIVSRSSGSSGKVLDIAYDSQAFMTYVLAGLRLYRMGFNYQPWHRQCYIYTSPYPMQSLFGMFPLQFIHTLTPIPEIIDKLKKAKPDLLVCYPSHLKQIALQMSDADRKSIQPKLISVNSEMSTQKERDELSLFFNCPVLDEYSSEELTRIAAQCQQGHYHIFEDINYIETIDAKGQQTSEPGTLIGTNLHNRAMPMIRYQQNDIAQIVQSQCNCGYQSRQLINFQGRKNDSFIMPSGKTINSGFLLDLTYDFLLRTDNAILDFCLIQKTRNNVELEIIPGSDWSELIKQEINTQFLHYFENSIHFSVKLVSDCTKTKLGKRNPIISLVKE